MVSQLLHVYPAIFLRLFRCRSPSSLLRETVFECCVGSTGQTRQTRAVSLLPSTRGSCLSSRVKQCCVHICWSYVSTWSQVSEYFFCTGMRGLHLGSAEHASLVLCILCSKWCCCMMCCFTSPSLLSLLQSRCGFWPYRYIF